VLHLTTAQAGCVIAAAIFNSGLAAAAIRVVLNDRPALRLRALNGQVTAAGRAPARLPTWSRQATQDPLRLASRRAPL
jgi:hypothetical protein